MLTVNVIEVPAHPFRTGVTVIVPDTVALVLLAGAVQPGIFPLPIGPSPIAVLLLVQLNVVPERFPEKLKALMAVPGQTETFVTGLTVGVG